MSFFNKTISAFLHNIESFGQISSDEANEYREIIADINDDIVKEFNSQTLAKYIPTANGNVITSTPVGYVIKDEDKNFPFQMDLLSNNLYTHTSCKLELATRFSDILYKEQEEIRGNTIIKQPGLSYNVVDGYFNDDPTYFVNNTPLNEGISTNITLSAITTKTEYVSVEWFGYVIPKTGDSITFGIEGDDACYLWIGNKAINDYSIENADAKNGGLHGMINETSKVQTFLNPGELYPIRIQYGQNAGGRGLILTINGEKNYDILYTLTKDNKIYKQKQQYYTLVENTQSDTAKGLFKCYITNMDKYPDTEKSIQNLNSTSSTTLTDNVEFEIIKKWGTGNPGSYAKVDNTGFHLYDSNGFKTVIQTKFSKTDSQNYWVELATYVNTVVININVDGIILEEAFSKNYSDSVACRKWENDKKRNNRIYALLHGGEINENNYLISNDSKYKLSISKQGELVLLRAKRITKRTKTDSNNIEFTYSNANSRYLYNFRCNPRMNKMYYVDAKNNQLNFIPYNSNFLTSTGKFSEFSSYVPQKISGNIKGDSTSCKSKCNANTLCSAVYAYKTTSNDDKCQFVMTSNENIRVGNLFNPLQPNSSINSSTLYIKDKQIKMSGNIAINGPFFSSEDGYKTYSAYSIGPSMTTAPLGLEETPEYKELAKEVCEILKGNGNCEQPQQTQGFQGFSKEGFTTYNSYDCVNNTGEGCKKFIQTYKIDPLIKTATDYSKALQTMDANNTTFSNNLGSYNTTYDDLSKNSVYQFRAEHTDFNNTKKSLLETANDDLDELLIQQNNMYIIGTITTATLLITAILLSSS
jgi:hypothetical protein